ncbi:HypC/HybG/HupF family hydrogenase formation chaperone [Vibrio sp. HA2012]|uniref:HypC/HybG/HupF family hydrogenase formation chaperone n=1 Tax=Vibrio sp. HA2012 TaxID=1971595 RepID=UPI000C2BAE04|nr:HypC/HybG/HupF family hydrogenase formation chaperone [Vibrio sp. HA2012]PJC87733.1 HypC/HybG/HupF family hydrogenase formation chaperone [Vibrio sp. HA2012]
MCLGVPGKVVDITDADGLSGIVDICGLRREVNLACVAQDSPEALLNHWVLIHVGFAMCVIDDVQAKATLEALATLQKLDG